MSSQNNIWFTSDTHYGHKNIVRGISSWEWQNYVGPERPIPVRDFDTMEEHNEVLVQNINAVVKENDELWHLGDWSFGGKENIANFRNRLHCKNINLVFGNHDQHIEPIGSIYRNCFSSLQYVKQFSIKTNNGKQGFFLSHYSHRVWNQSHHGVIHLFGHSHGSLPGIGKSMDVGVDTNNLKPYHIDEILARMKNIETVIVDHHNHGTN